MRTISQLREAGFTVAASRSAVQCTEVSSLKPFWYYNTRFYSTMADVRANLQAASLDAQGRYTLTVAGLHGDNEVLVYNILDEERHRILEDAQARYYTGMNDAERAKDDYEDALNTLEAYAD